MAPKAGWPHTGVRARSLGRARGVNTDTTIAVLVHSAGKLNRHKRLINNGLRKNQSIRPSDYSSVDSSVGLSVGLQICLSIGLSIGLSVGLSAAC